MWTCRRNLPHNFPPICLHQRPAHNYVETDISYYDMRSNHFIEKQADRPTGQEKVF